MTTSTAADGVGVVDEAGRAHRTWAELRDVARQDGLPPAWLRFAGVEGLCGPRGLCVRVQDAAADHADVDFLGFPYALPGGTIAATRCVAADVGAAQAEGLLWLRLGLSEALRDACVEHLRGRRSGETTVLLQQMVKLQFAEVLTEQLELEASLLTCHLASATPAELHRLHSRITSTDRSLLRLFGAIGYLSDGPGITAHVSELLADTFSSRGGTAWS